MTHFLSLYLVQRLWVSELNNPPLYTHQSTLIVLEQQMERFQAEQQDGGHISILKTASGHISILKTASGHISILKKASGHISILKTASGHISILKTTSGHISIPEQQVVTSQS